MAQGEILYWIIGFLTVMVWIFREQIQSIILGKSSKVFFNNLILHHNGVYKQIKWGRYLQNKSFAADNLQENDSTIELVYNGREKESIITSLSMLKPHRLESLSTSRIEPRVFTLEPDEYKLQLKQTIVRLKQEILDKDVEIAEERKKFYGRLDDMSLEIQKLQERVKAQTIIANKGVDVGSTQQSYEQIS